MSKNAIRFKNLIPASIRRAESAADPRADRGLPPRPAFWRGPADIRPSESGAMLIKRDECGDPDPVAPYHWRHGTDLCCARKRAAEAVASLPWNFWTAGSGKDGREQAIFARRVEGFLRALIESPWDYPAVIDMMAATQSPRGINSPRTTADLLGLIMAADFSPGRLQRALAACMWSAVKRAQSLRAAGIPVPRITWEHVANAVLRYHRDGGVALRRCRRAAIVAVARAIEPAIYGHMRQTAGGRWIRMKLPWESMLPENAGEFRRARALIKWLVKRTAGRWAYVHGVLTARTSGWHTVRGMRACKAVWRDTGSVDLVTGYLFELAPSRYFHVVYGALNQAADEAAKAKAAIDDAIDKHAAIQRDGVCLLVYREDSYAAGNCRAGTEAFIRRALPYEWRRKPFAPADVVMAAASSVDGSTRKMAMAAVRKAADRLAEQMQ